MMRSSGRLDVFDPTVDGLEEWIRTIEAGRVVSPGGGTKEEALAYAVTVLSPEDLAELRRRVVTLTSGQQAFLRRTGPSKPGPRRSPGAGAQLCGAGRAGTLTSGHSVGRRGVGPWTDGSRWAFAAGWGAGRARGGSVVWNATWGLRSWRSRRESAVPPSQDGRGGMSHGTYTLSRGALVGGLVDGDRGRAAAGVGRRGGAGVHRGGVLCRAACGVVARWTGRRGLRTR